MSMRAAIGLLLMLTESVCLYLAVGSVLHAAIPFSIALALLLVRRRSTLDRDRYAAMLCALPVAQVTWWLLFPPPLPFNPPLLGGATSFFYTAAIVCVWAQSLQIGVNVQQNYTVEPGPFPSFPLLGVFVLTIAGMFVIGDSSHAMYAAIAGVYVFLTAAYYLARDDSWGFGKYSGAVKFASIVILIGALVLGLLLSVALRRNDAYINLWLGSLTVPAAADSIGFSREGSLGDMTARQAAGPDRAALYVVADQAPGYLRGLAFESYSIRDGRWTLPKADRWQFPMPSAEAGAQRKPFHLLPVSSDTPTETFDILTTTSLLDAVFLPARTAVLEVSTESIVLDETGSVRKTEPVRRPGYYAITRKSADTAELSSDELAKYTEVPEALDPRVRDLARTITAGADSPGEVAAAVESYFHELYGYQIGIRIPRGQDPLNYFLLERPPAHCEYFATGAAIILRISGIPARYVTGFVAAERNPSGEFYVARNRDAHAWVEAWDPASGWFVVEATPSDAVPQAREAKLLDRVRDAVALRWARYRDRLAPDSFRNVLSTIVGRVKAIATTPLGWCLLAGFAALGGYRIWRTRKYKSLVLPETPEIVRLNRLLARADEIAFEAGAARTSSETIRQFYERLVEDTENRKLEELAAWYRAYERVRYRDLNSGPAYEYLESSLPAKT